MGVEQVEPEAQIPWPDDPMCTIYWFVFWPICWF